MTALDNAELDELARWSVADLHESLESRSFLSSVERAGSDVDRIVAAFDRLGIRAIEPRAATADDGRAADDAISAYNEVAEQFDLLDVYIYSTVNTDSSNEHAGPLLRLAARSAHQMSEAEEGLNALFASAVSRPTFDAMQAAVGDSLPDFRRWMCVKAGLHAGADALPWSDLVAPLPVSPGELTWDKGVGIVRGVFQEFSPQLGSIAETASIFGETLLSRAGMDTAEELGTAFGLDVSGEAFWEASLDVRRARMADDAELAADLDSTGATS